MDVVLSVVLQKFLAQPAIRGGGAMRVATSDSSKAFPRLRALWTN